MRSNGCGDLREQNIDDAVQLCGWVDRRRDHGGVIFIDLRDRSGTVQITVDPDLGAEAFAVAEHLRSETVLQVNGKVRGQIDVAADADQADILDLAKAEENVARHLEAKTVRKEIYVPNKLVNIVVG